MLRTEVPEDQQKLLQARQTDKQTDRQTHVCAQFLLQAVTHTHKTSRLRHAALKSSKMELPG